MIRFKSLSTFLIALSLVGCRSEIKETRRQASPDGALEFVVTQTGGPAFEGFTDRVFIVPKGGMPESGREVFKAQKIKGLAPSWKNDRTLEIRYASDRVYLFKNFWMTQNPDKSWVQVDIDLIREQPAKRR
jgi:hypothetical protein